MSKGMRSAVRDGQRLPNRNTKPRLSVAPPTERCVSSLKMWRFRTSPGYVRLIRLPESLNTLDTMMPRSSSSAPAESGFDPALSCGHRNI